MRTSSITTLLGAASLTSATILSKRTGNFQFHGCNEAAANFGLPPYPGAYGRDYVWPGHSSITHFLGIGFNTFRVNVQMERVTLGSIAGDVYEEYMVNLTDTVNLITGNGAYAMIDPHNSMRFNDEIITSTADFGAWWATVAERFKDNELVMFDVNNEPNTMDTTLVYDLNQAAIDAIRGAGATSQYITVEGNQWSNAWSWTTVPGQDGYTNAQFMGNLTDPSDKILYHMHLYLDENGSGNNETCVSETVGSERIAAATQWLKENGKVGILGEFAGGINDVCQAAIKDLLNHMNANSDVWLGFTWWAAGPWWGPVHYNSIEPSDGIAYDTYVPILEAAANGTIFPPPSSTTSTPSGTTTTAAATASLWEKCGGIGWTGPTQCPRASCCQMQNQWYWQCVLDCDAAPSAAEASATPTSA